MADEQRPRIVYWRHRRGPFTRSVVVALVSGVLACGGVADEGKLPPNVQDPATLKTPSGAVARYRGALAVVGGAFDRVMTSTGIFTDELAGLPMPFAVAGEFSALDARQNLSSVSQTVSQSLSNALHRLRGEAHEARGFLAKYAPDSSPALQGQLQAVEAYAEVWLADVFCSGIPLSTVDFEGNYTLTAGYRTSEVYRHAVALFDSALALAGDSVNVQRLVAVGKGRALLAVGDYAAAAAAVGTVPDDYVYQTPFDGGFIDFLGPTAPDSAQLWFFLGTYSSKPGTPSAADREGRNGLDYRSSGDPRTAVAAMGSTSAGDTMYFPLKYPQAGTVLYTLASGIEARLIEAEAALQVNPDDGQWLAMLNHLRQTVWTTIVPAVSGPLPDLADPRDTLPDPAAAKKAREDLLFRERAFWLYLTGHRQGDLRRLIRDYGRRPEEVYPTGTYPGASGVYMNEVVVPIPDSEHELNPQYAGCVDRNA